MLLLETLLDDSHYEAAIVVIDAALISTPQHTELLNERARLEHATLQPLKAIQTFSECFKAGGGGASDYLLYGQLLFHVANHQQAGLDAVSHAVEICKPAERFEVLLSCAFAKAGMGNRVGALSYLTEADSLGQLDLSLVKQLGELHSTVGDVATAVATFDRAAAMEPSDARIRQQRGACKDTLGDPIGAIEDLNAAIQLGLDNALTYRYRGLANMQLGQFEAALADLNQAVAKKPDHFEALLWRAEVNSRMGRIQDAVADMDLAHQIKPLTHNDQQIRKHYLRLLAENDAGMEHSPDAAHDMDNAEGLYRQAHVKRGQDDLVGALSLLDQAIQLQPEDLRFSQERANVQMRLSKYAEALQDLQILSATDSTWDTTNVVSMSSVCKARLGNAKEALADLDIALRIEPRNAVLLQERGAVKFVLHDFEGALADENAALQQMPDCARTLANRGVTLCMLRQLVAALADLDRANALCPNNAETLCWRALVKGDMGDWAGVVEDFDEAERHAPLDAYPLQHRAYARNMLSMPSKLDAVGTVQ